MDVERAVAEFLELYPAAYLRLYRRVDPRVYRPRPETLALLEHLSSTGPLTIAEAARHFDRSQSATSEIVARLLARGLLDRVEDARNRRRHLIWLTAAGREIVMRERQVLSRELVERAMSRMTAADRERLVRGMRALLETGSARPADPQRKGAKR
jgi:DNA-binding MarR family transcriptional regulator